MKKLDTIKINVPTHAILGFSKDCFDHQRRFNKKYYYLLREKTIPGLNGVEIRQNDVVLKMSSKILGERSHCLLSIDTIEEAFDRISKSGIIMLNATKAIESADLYLCHITQDVHINNLPIGLTIQSFRHYQDSLRVNLNIYPMETAEFIFGRSTNKKLSIHDQYKVITNRSKPEEKAFLRSLGHNAEMVIDKYRNVIRVELLLESYAAMRTALSDGDSHKEDIALMHMLSDRKPSISNELDKIVQGSSSIDIRNIGVVSRKGIRQLQQHLSDIDILNFCQWKYRTCKDYLKTMCPGSHPARILRRLKGHIRSKPEADVGTRERITEVLTKVRAQEGS